ncbi:Mutator mutT protein (7,8-dihydro-8-oxoguanine-triphosphatase) / Thiamin-phosphate pyrophosphorylase-like protein [Halomonas citrativorans]|uniref:8-oxo-dGTP diphosphatase n=1 Tax=Halomonas citrativorans TaxID=2742612 RepID=A0A1R4I1X9_9GAMM|nr:Nudix family hydrolase [Halomonas citrativorans]MBE0402089.1 Nudix family hydrolase [Halomonas citrativorans]SJN13795.1 Mutator mutT protein (7,8-dihydro-8-oxoguanine-triphosphatase) / Thiamin-phosphate pyrophosphorylase-like protein [Halomonas citrativorans]
MVKRRVHVAAAAIISADQKKVLIARRPSNVDQGGLWEFPGGKLAPYETGLEGLKRELHEELGVEIVRAQPLIRVHHEYPDKHILLDVWQVHEFAGEPFGREGQAVRWVPMEELANYPFPAANLPILRAVMLPTEYLITKEEADEARFDTLLERALKEDNIRLVQLRAKQLDEAAYLKRAERALRMCHEYGAKLLLNGEPALLEHVDADGIHLTSERLMQLDRRPIAEQKWLSASTHDQTQLSKAALLGCDFVTLSPLRTTPSHPEVAPMGWHDFQQLVERAGMPVFALGGMTRFDANHARAVGAQGIASIRDFWK